MRRIGREQARRGPSRTSVIKIVEGFLYGARDKNLTGVPLAPQLVLDTPLSHELRGSAAITDYLLNFAPMVTDVRVWDHVVEGELCTTRFDWETLHGSIPALGCFRVHEGALSEVRTFYNLREFADGVTRESAAVAVN
jgi:hypothetical protein